MNLMTLLLPVLCLYVCVSTATETGERIGDARSEGAPVLTSWIQTWQATAVTCVIFYVLGMFSFVYMLGQLPQ